MNASAKPIVVCVFSLSLLVSGCGPEQLSGPTVTPTPTNTATSTITPSPTITATSTITPSPTATITSTPIGGSVGRLALVMQGPDVQDKVATFLINSDGSNLIKVTSVDFAWFTSWSSDGKRIVYGSDDDNSYIINTDGSNVEKIKRNFTIPEPLVGGYVVSPDGNKIAFFARTFDYTSPGVIYVADFDGLTVTNPRFLCKGSGPVWSPDGSRIAFSYKYNPSSMRVKGNIYVIDSDGSNQVSLTMNSGDNSSPSWSPDGSKIAFYSMNQDAHIDYIYIMNSDGSNTVKLTESSPDYSSWPNDPSWSPDGHKIAFLQFSRKSPEALGELTSSIYLINVDGTNKTLMFDCSPNLCSDITWAP